MQKLTEYHQQTNRELAAGELIIHLQKSLAQNNIFEFVRLYTNGATYQIGIEDSMPVSVELPTDKILNVDHVDILLAYNDAIDGLRNSLAIVKEAANDNSLNRGNSFINCLWNKPESGVASIRSALGKVELNGFDSVAKLITAYNNVGKALKQNKSCRSNAKEFYQQAIEVLKDPFVEHKTTNLNSVGR